MTSFTNLDYNEYTKTVVKLSKRFRYMDLSDRKKSLRLYPELLMHVPNPSEVEQFSAVMMKPSLMLFIKEPSQFIRMVAMALDPTLTSQLSAHSMNGLAEGVWDQQKVDFEKRAELEFIINSFNVSRHYATDGMPALMMEKTRSENIVFEGYFDDAPAATHQDAMQQIHAILTHARALVGRGDINLNSVQWLLPSLPAIEHLGVRLVVAALGVHSPVYGKLDEQPDDVLEMFFEFNGSEAYSYWNKQVRDTLIPEKYWTAMVSKDGWALNFQTGQLRKLGKSPSAKLCKLALSNVSGVELLLFEGLEQSFKNFKLDSIKEGLQSECRYAANQYDGAGEAKAEKIRKKLIDSLGI